MTKLDPYERLNREAGRRASMMVALAFTRAVAQLLLVLATALSPVLWPTGAQAADLTCDNFKVRLAESLAQYKYGVPRYESLGGTVSLKGWLVRGIFDDVNPRLICRNSYFSDFLVDANSADDVRAALHVGLFAGVALHAFGLEWPEALSIRDKLVRTRRTATITKIPVGEGVASMAISIAGIPDFELNSSR